MIVCRKCRANNADPDAFCGSCGAFLEWTGEKIAPPASPKPQDVIEGVEPTPRPGLLERMQSAVGAVIAPAPAREDSGSAWTGFGAVKPPGGAQPAATPAPQKAASATPAKPAAHDSKQTAKAAPAKDAAAPPAKAASPAGDEGQADAVSAKPARVTAEPVEKPVEKSVEKPVEKPVEKAPSPSLEESATASERASQTAAGDGSVVQPRELAGAEAAALVVEVRGEAAARKAGPTSDEVLPQQVPVRVAPVMRTKSTRRLQPGDLVCGQCGEGNPPTRKFCSRCGESLVTADIVRPRWHARLMIWRRGPKMLEAGTRTGEKGAPSSRRAAVGQVYRRVRNAVAGLMLLASLLYVAVPPLRTPANRVLEPPVGAATGWVSRTWHNLTANSVTVPPNRVGASAELSHHPASAAFDNNTNSFWAARWNPKRPPSMTVHYDDAVDLVAFAVHAGAPGDADASYLHPSELVIRYGSGRVDTIELTAAGDAQTGGLDQATSFRFARITITKVYDKDGVENVALSELELKERT